MSVRPVTNLGLGRTASAPWLQTAALRSNAGARSGPTWLSKPDPGTLGALVYGGRGLEEALRSEEVRIEGDEMAVNSFLTLFPLPEVAVPAAGS